ncbi:Pimeloyl-ACP methyl ester carboxylesterase [Reichenbachiella faecimaris]|uniref:Pimeloyl-ACP methyl ester carboxylesterase n=1 Tax=Reichenbachiella faecimaris TaxID=692418 RepID=A0A1W2G9B6_REIFA|nr:alpha/beta hydrolase [Reichenbachiella faecimaris]SMD32938.1 Pimeloyl-ACP methyl ester carboxylesterase [Reichenbachiella faecimaris]
MSKTPKLYTFSNSIRLEYMAYGYGKKTLICFHGFGQNYQVFEKLATELNGYQVIGINLFFHGKSDRTSGTKYLSHEEWKKILNGFLHELGINNFSVFGYSMGGRYVASTIQSFSDRIDHCFFIAPDGIVKRSAYEFATFPLGSEQLFGFFMRNPKPFFTFLYLIEQTRLFNQWTINFSRSQLRDKGQRMKVYKSWVMLRKFRLSQKTLIKLLNTAPFQSAFIFGKYDNIIQPKRHFHFLSQLKKAKVTILDTGHTKLLNESFSKIADFLSSYQD